MINTNYQSNISVHKYEIFNPNYELVRLSKRTTSTVNTNSSPNAIIINNYLTENYSELINNKLNTVVQHLLKENRTIDMPICFNSSVFFVQHRTKSPVANYLLERNDTYTAFINYDSSVEDQTESDSAASLVSVDFLQNESNRRTVTTIKNHSKHTFINDRIISKQVAEFMFERTPEIINVLEKQLNKHNITVTKASLEYSLHLGCNKRDITLSMGHDYVDYIFLRPFADIFKHFEFKYINNDTPNTSTDTSSSTDTPIQDPIILWNALTNNETFKIESYDTKEEAIQKFKIFSRYKY